MRPVSRPPRRPARPARSAPLALLLPLLHACAAAEGEAAGAVERVAVRTAPVEHTTAAPPVVGTGTLAAREEAPLGFAVGGVVARVLVREGDRVRRGQPLAALDLREVEARLGRARAALAKAERDLARARALHADSVATRQQLDDATTARDVAAADLAEATHARRYAAIAAPGDGVVLRRHVDPGQVVAPGAPVLTVGDRSAGTVLRVAVADRDVVRLRPGDRAEVRFDARPAARHAATVASIAGASASGTGAFAVELRLAGADALPSGLVGRATIVPGAAEPARLVPAAAIVEADGDQGSVFVVAADGAAGGAGRARRVRVRLGAVRGAQVPVVAGLDGVARVVTDGAGFLTDGTPVRVVP